MPSPLENISDKQAATLFALPAPAAPVDDVAALWEDATDASATTTIRHDRQASLEVPAVKARRLGRPGEGELDYELGDMIGEGGLGRVFEARQTAMNRVVALKRLRPEYADDPRARARFLHEALFAADFDHPNLLKVYDAGVDQDGQPFCAMPRIEGLPWARSIRERSRVDNLALLAKLADAVAYLHARGAVHRDIKPANVLIGPNGELLLMDWGMAARLPDPARGRGLPPDAPDGGTPAYMAPEMARGERALIGFPGDVYLLGATLYEILTGAPPHRRGNAGQSLRNAAHGADVWPKVSGPLGILLRASLSVDPAGRPTATVFAGALCRTVHAGRRRRWLWAAASLFVAVAAGFILWRLWSSATRVLAPQPPEYAATSTPTEPVVKDQANPMPLKGAVMTGLTREEAEQMRNATQP